jgi:hypothetical protein
MKVHTSHYEEDLGWINLYTETPPVNTRVRLALIHIIDWNMEKMIWETEGWITTGGIFSLKTGDLLKIYDTFNFSNSKPTHWQPL